RNWWGIMLRQKRMTYFTSGYGLGAWIVPSIVAAPRYFRGELGLGGLMQTSQAFQQVQDALSFFVQSYKEIAAWSAVVERLAGIWPFGRGEIRAARDARILFLPQRPYLPIGVLRDVVSYPMPASGVEDGTLREALEVVGLTELAVRLDDAAHWALRLSPGEQQRIAFARALVQKPEWLFLDEATSAVDEATEARLYRLVRERLAE